MYQVRIRGVAAPGWLSTTLFALGIPREMFDKMRSSEIGITDLGAPINSPIGMFLVAESVDELVATVLELELEVKIDIAQIDVPRHRKSFFERPFWVPYAATIQDRGSNGRD